MTDRMTIIHWFLPRSHLYLPAFTRGVSLLRLRHTPHLEKFTSQFNACHSSSRYEGRPEFVPMEMGVCDEETEAYVTNLSYYHLVPFETDILE